MISRMHLLSATLSMAALTAPMFAQELPNEGPVPTTALISVESKSNQPLNPQALKLEVNGHDAAISSVEPVSKEGAQVAILIDDGLRGNFDVQLKDVKSFIQKLPANVKVLVGYMQNGTVRSSTGFSSDHQAAASELRVPLGTPGISGSPYFCLQDFVKHWPGQGNNTARMVLMITNGVDLYNGSVSPLNQDSPYVEHAQDAAQRAGVAVYSIYYSDRGIGGGLASFSGQSYLNQVAEATGGESFYQGRITPPSLAPYFNDFQKSLAESYVIAFQAPAHERHDELTPIKLRSEQEGLKLHAPHAVHPGLVEQASE